MLPLAFVASSSEGLLYARAVAAHLAPFCRVTLWDAGVFEPGNYTLEDLARAVRDHDIAVLVCTPDDLVTKRGTVEHAVRDNLIFELGLCCGLLGRRRTFPFVPAGVPLAWPSDLNGLTNVRYPWDPTWDADRVHEALRDTTLRLGETIGRRWRDHLVEAERAREAMILSERAQTIRRLYAVVIEVRELLIKVPTKALESLGRRKDFDAVRTHAATRISTLKDTLLPQAESVGVGREFSALMIATRGAVKRLPYPDHIPMSKSALGEALLETFQAAQGAFVAAGQDDPWKAATSAIEVEFSARLTGTADQYRRWWSRAHEDVQEKTQIFQDALFQAVSEPGLPARSLSAK